MFKRIFIFIIAAALIGAAIWQNWYIDGAVDDLSALASSAEAAYHNGDLEGALANATALYGEWEKRQKTLGNMIAHEEIDNIHENIRNLIGDLTAGNDAQIPANFLRIAYYLEHLYTSDALSFSNIF